ncbi:MAG: hypothetical protein IT329_19985 [Caldilineaceae bacterium]|nr:hypothetical protein [Caldilineaceae bacterium]
MDDRRLPFERPAPARDEHRTVRLSILGGILLCALIAALLADSLLGVYVIDAGEAIPRGWRWLLGAPEQTFATQTLALLFGVLLLGFALGGFWFLAGVALRRLRRQWLMRG